MKITQSNLHFTVNDPSVISENNEQNQFHILAYKLRHRAKNMQQKGR